MSQGRNADLLRNAGVSQISPYLVRSGKSILILITVRFLSGESIGLEHLRSSGNLSDCLSNPQYGTREPNEEHETVA
jgi:hypothetical protein